MGGVDVDEGKSSSSFCNWHSQRHVIVLASLGGVLAATVVVITISVVLQPAHVGFTLERAIMVTSNDEVRLNLTVKIAKNTTSGGNVGAKVRYRSVHMYLVATSPVNATTIKGQTFELERATMKPQPPTVYLDGPAEVIINAVLDLVGNSKQSALAMDVVHGVGVTLIIQAQVSFHIGLVKTTGWYDITLSSPGVVFPASDSEELGQ